MSSGELVLYTAEDGTTQIYLRAEDHTVWLTQLQLAELFETTKQNISLHVRNIFAEGELLPEATVKESLTVQIEGRRQVRRTVQLYNLDLILAVGYRVSSPRGRQFRNWASTHLKEYLIKGFALDDSRLKDAGFDYFDELLERIREIRASEKRFYQKVRELFSLAVDYQADTSAAATFFAEVQNKMLFAVTGKTAAEIVVERCDPAQPHMALTSWSGSRVRKCDVIIAKNYLASAEIDHLNRIVVAFLEFAELRITQRRQLRMADWREYVDNFIQFNEHPLLKGVGQISHEHMVQVAHDCYDEFEVRRRRLEAEEADAQDIQALEQIARRARDRKKS